MDREDLLARRLAGEDVGTGEPRISYEPIHPARHPDGEVKIGKSLRVPMAMFEQISAVAGRRRMSWSALVREWIVEGLANDDTGNDVDPVIELHRHLDAATRALRTLRRQPERRKERVVQPVFRRVGQGRKDHRDRKSTAGYGLGHAG